jgi:hypothetical protein
VGGEGWFVAAMEADLAGEGSIGVELGIAIAAGVVHLIAALPCEVDAVSAGVTVDAALNGTEREFAAAVRVEPDVGGPKDVDERGVPKLDAGEGSDAQMS